MFLLIPGSTGATAQRMAAVADRVRGDMLDQQSDGVGSMTGAAGFGFAGQRRNIAAAFAHPTHRSERSHSAGANAGPAFAACGRVRDARMSPVMPHSATQIGTVSRFDLHRRDAASPLQPARPGRGNKPAARPAE